MSAPTRPPMAGAAVNPIEKAAMDAAVQALGAAEPTIRQSVATYAQQYIQALQAGKNPQAVPELSVTTLSGKELTIASAKSRGLRTFVEGLGLDIVWALIALIGTVSNVDFFTRAGWITLGILVAKTVVQTAIAYIARIKFAPSYQQVPATAS